METQTQARSNWIPWDLWLQILSFLPVRSLLVFRSVCKSFLSIIDDPEFVSLHLVRFPGNASKTRFLCTHKDSYKYNNHVVFEAGEINNLFASSSSTWDYKIIDQPEISTMVTPLIVQIHWNLKCSVNGLLLMYDKYCSSTSVAVLWNPSINKHRQLSLPSPNTLWFGLGHDSSCADYKLIAFDDCHDQAWVYSDRTDTWTEIFDNRCRQKLGKDCAYYYSRSLSLKNRVFWIEYYDNRVAEKLLLFNFETERFRYAEMPYSADEMAHGRGLVLLDCGSAAVGVWWVNDVDDHVLVWALETDGLSWTLRYKIAPPHGFHAEMAVYGFIYGSRLEERNGESMWKYWDASDRCLRVGSYEFDVMRQVYRNKFVRVVQDCLDIYFESLVMLM